MVAAVLIVPLLSTTTQDLCYVHTSMGRPVSDVSMYVSGVQAYLQCDAYVRHVQQQRLLTTNM